MTQIEAPKEDLMAATKKRPAKKSGERVDVYQLVTDRIVEALEQGIVPWHKPWKNSRGEGPASLSTGREYQGVNVWLLTATAAARGYSSRWWGTYKQITERGGQVRKGEKSTVVVFWRFVERPDPLDPSKVTKIPFLRFFYVFNADQADDVKLPEEPVVEPFNSIEACERIAAGYVGGPAVKHGGNRAAYSPLLDEIYMPKPTQFDSSEHYYGTLFHEQSHSTGHESRLKRSGITDLGSFGDENYSREELIAEMSSAFLCGEAGIPVNVQHHAAYIGSWVQKLRGDTKLVVQAAGAAQKSANMILGRSPATGGEEA